MDGTFNMTGLADVRTKPETLKRHKNSDFEYYLPRHMEGSPNVVAAPYPIDERGRLKKTQVLDHIIKLKRDTSKKIEKIESDRKQQNEETFINYLLEKKQIQKEEKRRIKLKREGEARGSNRVL